MVSDNRGHCGLDLSDIMSHSLWCVMIMIVLINDHCVLTYSRSQLISHDDYNSYDGDDDDGNDDVDDDDGDDDDDDDDDGDDDDDDDDEDDDDDDDDVGDWFVAGEEYSVR